VENWFELREGVTPSFGANKAQTKRKETRKQSARKRANKAQTKRKETRKQSARKRANKAQTK